MIDLFLEDQDPQKPPFMHCLSTRAFDVKQVEQFCLQRGYGFYDIDIQDACSREAMLDLFAASMKFPAYFGRNWDAFVDLASDLSWDKHPGYITVVENADRMLEFPRKDLTTFLAVCNAITSRWQEEEDEYGNTVKPVSFHFLLVGSDAFCHQAGPLLNLPTQ
jgi:hypothetical protein